MSLVEFRSYQLQPGSRQKFSQLMQEQSLPLLAADGQQVLFAQATADGSDHFLLVRAYKDQAERESSQQRFYNSPAWRQGPRSAILACIIHSHDCLVEFDTMAFSALDRAFTGTHAYQSN